MNTEAQRQLKIDNYSLWLIKLKQVKIERKGAETQRKFINEK